MSSTAPRSSGLLSALRVFCLLLIGLHLAAPRMAEETSWGLWPVTYVSPLWRWLFAALAAHAVDGMSHAVAAPVMGPLYSDSVPLRARGVI